MSTSSGLLPRRVILASASPRRKDLLQAAGFEVIVRPSSVTEHAGGMSPRDLVIANAVLKAREVAAKHQGDLVIGADTIVVLRDQILGKPTDWEHARTMLAQLSGNIHEVLTGVCMIRGGSAEQCVFVEATRVKFRSLDEASITAYLREIDPLDKAGAYAAQEDRGRLIEYLEGPLDTVIGLPVSPVIRAMEAHFTEQPSG